MWSHEYMIFVYAFGTTFLLSAGLTVVVRRVALRMEILDHPGERKVHGEPIPLLGGVAIILTFYGFVLAHLAALAFSSRFGADWIEVQLLAVFGEQGTLKLAGFLVGGLLIFLLGIIDDLWALRPWMKLLGQVVAAGVLVAAGIHVELFVLPYWLAVVATIFWIVMITNSMNFLDNMDGLSGGVAVIAALSFFLAVQPHEDQLVRWLLMIFAGAVGGFLYHNMSPAKIFMGDAGSMFNGYFLATVAVLGTYHIEETPSRIAVAAPVLALSVPLFDTFSVIWIRWRNGQSIMLGDKRHFSHRLVELGMTPRQAVEFIFLVAAVVGLGGALLPLLGDRGTIIILAQTGGVFLLIALLMKAARNRS